MGKRNLRGSAKANTFQFRTGNGQLLQHQDVIFPIVKQTKDGKHSLVGTGFFICMQGVFITAAHVLQDVFDENGKQKENIAVFHFNEAGGYIIRPITWAWYASNADVAVGIVMQAHHNVTKAPLTNSIATLTWQRPKVGEKIVTYAYPDFANEQDGEIQKVYFSPNFYDGEIAEYYPQGRDRVLMPSPCYRTNIHIHGGASGGPVLDEQGRVFGVNCRSMEPDTDISFVTPIEAILAGRVAYSRFSEDEEPREVSIQEFIDKGHIIVD